MTLGHSRASEGAAVGSGTFAELDLIEPLERALRGAGYQHPTPIQRKAIPPALDGRDVLGCAQTGTGKTAAFVLPILQQLHLTARAAERRRIRSLVLAPTRELAAQIGDSITKYGKHLGIRSLVIFGGVSQGRQVDELRRGIDILVATPGRLWDLIEQRFVDLGDVEVLVLDECDRMLDQGFWPTIKRIVAKVPKDRQTMFFSATMPKELEPLASQLLSDPARVSVTPIASTPDRIDQLVWHVEQPDKRHLLEHILRTHEINRAVVFTKTKHGANRVAKHLGDAGIRAEAIHGNKSQNARERALTGFRSGDLRVLVATDLAARGLDIEGVSHVINYDLPVDPESYVHRIGRTARAGREGVAFSLCSRDERGTLTRIERLISRPIAVAEGEAPRRASAPEARAAQGPRNVREHEDRDARHEHRHARPREPHGNPQRAQATHEQSSVRQGEQRNVRQGEQRNVRQGEQRNVRQGEQRNVRQGEQRNVRQGEQRNVRQGEQRGAHASHERRESRDRPERREPHDDRARRRA